MAYQPTISIIIAVKNANALLQETLESIRVQDYPGIEIIVIDGNSNDGTLEVIKANQDIIKESLSEPDLGISDAFNKGLKRASGDYINFQGAGDILYTPECISKLMNGIDPSILLICGKVIRVKEDGITPIWIAPKKIKPFHVRSLLFKMSLPHQSLFTHHSFFKQYGFFDVNVKFAMDYEMLLRAYHHFPKTIVKDVIISKWRAGGIGHHKIFEILDEYHHIKEKNRIASKTLLKAINVYSRAKYAIKSNLGLSY